MDTIVIQPPVCTISITCKYSSYLPLLWQKSLHFWCQKLAVSYVRDHGLYSRAGESKIVLVPANFTEYIAIAVAKCKPVTKQEEHNTMHNQDMPTSLGLIYVKAALNKHGSKYWPLAPSLMNHRTLFLCGGGKGKGLVKLT